MAKTNRLVAEPGSTAERLKAFGERDNVDLLGLLEKTAGGDKAAAAAAVEYMRGRPDVADLVLAHARTAQDHWLDYATTDAFTRFTFEGRARQLRRDLRGESPTALERVLVERIVVCSLQLQIAERQFMRVMEDGSSFAKASFYESLQDRAHRRYLAAIKALAQVRRLQLPVVAQLNVAQNQVNLAHAAGTSPAQSRVDAW